MYQFFIGFRYFKTRLITLLSIAGVAIGVMALIVVLSVMDGFKTAFQSRVKGTLSDLIVSVGYRDAGVPQNFPSYKNMEEDIFAQSPHITACAPHIIGLVLLGTGYSWTGGKITGIDYTKEYRVGKFKDYLITAYKEEKIWAETLFEENVKYAYHRIYQWKVLGGEALSNGVRVLCLREEYGSRNIRQPKQLHNSILRAYTIDMSGKITYIEKSLPPHEVIVKFQDSREQKKWEKYFEGMEKALANRNLVEYISFFHPDLQHDQGSIDIANPFLYKGEKAEYSPAIIGQPILQSHGIRIGQEIGIMTGVRDPQTKNLKPRSKKFQVVGSFKSGWQEIDAYYIYTPIEELQGFIDIPGEVTEICVALDDYKYADSVQRDISSIIPKFALANVMMYVEKWEDTRKTMLTAIELERNVMAFILFMIIILAVGTIVIILVLLVIEKTRDIGIIKSMGASNTGVMSIFVLNGLFVSIVGSIIGCILGFVISREVNWISDRVYELTGFRVFPKDVYYLDQIPVGDITIPWLLIWIIGPTLIISLIGCMIPAIKASRLNPVEAIKWE